MDYLVVIKIFLKRLWLSRLHHVSKIVLAMMFLSGSIATIAQTCNGRFLNPFSDICWDCMGPITISGVSLGMNSSWDYDSGAPNGLCVCANSLSVGLKTSFWEPIYQMDVSNTPGCMPGLGARFPIPSNSGQYGATVDKTGGKGSRSNKAFAQVNLYVNPILSIAGFLYSNPCLDRRSFDIPWISVMDPSWADDGLTLITQPWSFAFTSMPAMLASGPDAVAANTYHGIGALYWTAGSWGNIYPTTGTVENAYSPEQVSHLLMTRILAKNHALGLIQSTAGVSALQACGAFGVPEFLMDKRQYKISRSLPFIDNQCLPIGRSTLIQETGAAGATDKDYAYMIFRKKDCCAGFGPQ